MARGADEHRAVSPSGAPPGHRPGAIDRYRRKAARLGEADHALAVEPVLLDPVGQCLPGIRGGWQRAALQDRALEPWRGNEKHGRVTRRYQIRRASASNSAACAAGVCPSHWSSGLRSGSGSRASWLYQNASSGKTGNPCRPASIRVTVVLPEPVPPPTQTVTPDMA